MKNIVVIIINAFLFTGCEKIIELDYKGNESRVIIEGNITNATGPYFIKVTRSVGLQDIVSYPTLDNAVVTISDDSGNSETLIPQGSGIYRTTMLSGVEGRAYTLTVEAGNEVYTAQSTMPPRVPFDSIKIETVAFVDETEYNLIPVYNDPVVLGNYYRYVLSVNNKLINQHLVLNDAIINGAVNTLPLQVNDEGLTLQPGDLISIEMQCIDKKVAMFYTALALMADGGPGGGTTPNNPPGNISNGALGIFSVHTVQTINKVIP